MPCVLKTSSRANVPCVLTLSCTNMPCALTWSRAYVSCVLTCSRAYVSCVLTCSRAYVPTCLALPKQFSLDLYNQKPTNEETQRICRVDVNAIAFNHASILAHLLLLLLLTLTTKYKLSLKIIFYQPER